jgi:hypothetical protein
MKRWSILLTGFLQRMSRQTKAEMMHKVTNKEDESDKAHGNPYWEFSIAQYSASKSGTDTAALIGSGKMRSNAAGGMLPVSRAPVKLALRTMMLPPAINSGWDTIR